MRRTVCIFLLSCCLAACQAPPAPVDPDVLASWDGGTLRIADVDAFLLRQQVTERFPEQGTSSRAWLEEKIRLLFEQRVLMADMDLETLEADAAFAESWQDKREDLLVRAYERQHNEPFEVDAAAVKAYFDEHVERWRTPERRVFQNLLVAFEPGASEEDKDARCAEAEDLRQQAVQGASFTDLVKRHSDSSNAATGGLVAALQKSQLRGEVGELLFSMESGQASRVLRNRAGCQIFLVREIIPAIEPKAELLQEEIAKTLAEERRSTWRRDLIRQAALAQGVELPAGLDDPAFDWSSVAVDEVLFELGDDRLVLADLLPHVRGGMAVPQALEREVSRRLFVAALENSEDPFLLRQLELAQQRHAFEAQRRRALRTYLLDQPDDTLRSFYDEVKARYMSDPRLELTLYAWRIGSGDPITYLQRPRDFAAALEAAPERADALWQEQESLGDVERLALPQMGLRDLVTQRPELSAVVMEEHVEGDTLGPHRSGNFIYLAQINVYIPSRQLSFLEVQTQVQSDFIAERGDAMAEAWSRDLAQEHGLQIYDEHLESFGQRLVEQLTDGG